MTNLDCIQALVKDLQASRNEILCENEKLANEVVKLKKELNEVIKRKDEIFSENKELATEVCKLNKKLEEYKKLCCLDSQAKDNLQSVIQNSHYERDKLQVSLKEKDETLCKLKQDFETFMDEVCDENKMLKDTIESKEKQYSKIDKLKDQNECYKTYIEKLEKEVMECLKKIACLQESIITSDKRNEEVTCENQKQEKKIGKLTDKLEKTSKALDATTGENLKLTEQVTQLKAGVIKAEKCNAEYLSEIEKFDKLTCVMEQQLKENKEYIQKLEERFNAGKACKLKLQTQVESLAAELKDEKSLREALDEELCSTKQAHNDCMLQLSDTVLELEKTKESFRNYKRNIQSLRRQIQCQASHSCPPVVKGKCGKPKLRKPKPIIIKSCELLYRNTKNMKSLLSFPTNDPCMCGYANVKQTRNATGSKMFVSQKESPEMLFCRKFSRHPIYRILKKNKI
uniref:Uncharacterized protein n=1 Tax=Cacopsylla melanoneura TaxID=428564 RepID=A0A8D8XAY0_9HEMI